MDVSQLQAQEREFCVTILSSFSCICRLSWVCIFRETSIKASRNATSSLTVFPHCFLLLTVLPLDCYPTPTGLFCPPFDWSLWVPFLTDLLSSLGPPSPRPLPVGGRSRAQALCLGFALKQTKRSSAWDVHPHNVTFRRQNVQQLNKSICY